MPCSVTRLPSDDLSFWMTKQQLCGFCEKLRWCSYAIAKKVKQFEARFHNPGSVTVVDC
jgi:hypothetical protein